MRAEDNPLTWESIRVPLYFIVSWALFGGAVAAAVSVSSGVLALAITLFAFTVLIAPFWFFASRHARITRNGRGSTTSDVINTKGSGSLAWASLSTAVVLVGLGLEEWTVTIVAYAGLLGCLVLWDLNR